MCAVIVHQRWTDLHLNYILGASGTITPPASWQVTLNTTAVATMARNSVFSASISGTNINEIGSTTPSNYARQTIAKTIAQAGVDWAASTFDNTLATGGTSMVGDQVTFGAFSGAPAPNGANSWTIAELTPINTGNPYLSGDTAATRNFANGDTEKVTPTVKSG